MNNTHTILGGVFGFWIKIKAHLISSICLLSNIEEVTVLLIRSGKPESFRTFS